MKGGRQDPVSFVVALANENPGGTAELGFAYAAAGRTQQARKMLRNLAVMSSQQYVSPCDYALIYVGLGDKDKAFTWLEKAYREGAVMAGAFVDPRWDAIRNDPRYQDLKRRMGVVRAAS